MMEGCEMEIWLNRYCFGIGNKVFHSKQQAEDSAVFDGNRHFYIGAVKACCPDEEIIDSNNRNSVTLYTATATMVGSCYLNSYDSMEGKLSHMVTSHLTYEDMTMEELNQMSKDGYSIKVIDKADFPWAVAMKKIEKRLKDE